MDEVRLLVRDAGCAPPGEGPGADICLRLTAGSVACLVGPNGSGKSSLLGRIAGTLPARGPVILDGVDVSQLPLHERFRRGLVLAPAGGRVLAGLSVRENLLLGSETRGRRRPAGDEIAAAVAHFPWIADRLEQPAETLSGGERHIVSAAASILTAPRVLLLDEPAAGLSHASIGSLAGWLGEVAAAGAAVLVTEQAPAVSEGRGLRTILIASGRVVGETTGRDLSGEGAAAIVRRLFFSGPDHTQRRPQ